MLILQDSFSIKYQRIRTFMIGMPKKKQPYNFRQINYHSSAKLNHKNFSQAPPINLLASINNKNDQKQNKTCFQKIKQLNLTNRSSFNVATIKKLTQLKRLKTEENRAHGFNFHENSLIHKVKILELYRTGNFSKVYRAVLTTKTSKEVIVKKINVDQNHKSRQQMFAKVLKSPYVVAFVGCYHSNDHSNDNQIEKNNSFKNNPAQYKHEAQKLQYLNIVMQKYDNNLSEVLQFQALQPHRIKIYLYQMLRSLIYIHSLGICHRDIKPHNFVIKNNRIFLCDFGASKKIQKNQKSISYIFAREYRAPQLLFDFDGYDQHVDIWALGCVAAQMILRKPLFNGSSNLDQLIKILKILGSPKWQTISFSNNRIPKIPQMEGCGIEQVLLDKCQISLKKLIGRMLKIQPNERISAVQALCDPYFDQIRQQSFYRSRLRLTHLPNFFYFQKRQIFGQEHFLQKLVPYWLKQHCKRFQVSLKDYKF